LSFESSRNGRGFVEGDKLGGLEGESILKTTKGLPLVGCVDLIEALEGVEGL